MTAACLAFRAKPRSIQHSPQIAVRDPPTILLCNRRNRTGQRLSFIDELEQSHEYLLLELVRRVPLQPCLDLTPTLSNSITQHLEVRLWNHIPDIASATIVGSAENFGLLQEIL
jgi:hypothetical protein